MTNVGNLRAELVGWSDDVPVTVAVPDRQQPSVFAILPIVSAGYGPGFDAGSDPVLSASFPITAAHHDVGPTSGDKWRIPERMFGPMPDDFYGAVGRVVTLSALLEDRLRTLLQTIRHVEQTAHAMDGPGRFIPKLRRQAARLGRDWTEFPAYLADVETALERRNAVVHSLWQPKSDGFYGHRLDRTPKRSSTTTTLDELRADIGTLVHLVDRWQPWFALAGAVPLPSPGDESGAP